MILSWAKAEPNSGATAYVKAGSEVHIGGCSSGSERVPPGRTWWMTGLELRLKAADARVADAEDSVTRYLRSAPAFDFSFDTTLNMYVEVRQRERRRRDVIAAVLEAVYSETGQRDVG